MHRNLLALSPLPVLHHRNHQRPPMHLFHLTATPLPCRPMAPVLTHNPSPNLSQCRQASSATLSHGAWAARKVILSGRSRPSQLRPKARACFVSSAARTMPIRAMDRLSWTCRVIEPRNGLDICFVCPCTSTSHDSSYIHSPFTYTCTHCTSIIIIIPPISLTASVVLSLAFIVRDPWRISCSHNSCV
jgi:hypothetical protein